ncbi:MAG TPA: glycosyltransferase family 39 protein [Ramlibacter sp.]|nr:glycosyltransferase family 39 protein [Ramlibacter sp.]
MSAAPNIDPAASASAPIGPERPARAWPGRLAFTAILALAAALRLWHLDQNGYGRMYYAAGVRSMTDCLHCFFYNSFDPAGFVSLDKPPVSMWLQVLGAKLLGFSAFSVMLPQVLEGLAAVVLVYLLVVRRFGRTAALMAAACLAIAPISVAVDRSNNTDSCLIMVLLLAAWAAIRAAETARLRLLVLAMVIAGVGFNVKMAAAWVVVPSMLLAYWLGAQELPVKQRLRDVALSGLVLIVVSLSWAFAFDLTPADRRPYAGSTRHNSMLELAVLHNGLDRFVQPSPDKAGAPPEVPVPAAAAGEDIDQQAAPTAPLWDLTPVGPLRLATPHLAAQLAWLAPLAIAGVAFGAMPWRRKQRLSAQQLNIVLWSGWAFTYAAVFSFAGGVFHTYYLAVLAPPVAALSGIGWAALWRRFSDRSLRLGLPVAFVATAAWQAYIERGYVAWRYDDWRSWLLAWTVGALLLAAAAMTAARDTRWPRPLAALGLFAMLATPAAWALSTVLVRPNVAAPAPDIGALAHGAAASGLRAAPAGTRASARKLIRFLQAQRGTERFLVAVPNAMQAAPLIVRTGAPVMAMGGYLGRDPILATRDLERMVSDGQLRFVMLGGYSIVTANSPRQRALEQWIRAHGTPVDPALWRDTPPASEAAAKPLAQRRAGAQLYDLRGSAS